MSYTMQSSEKGGSFVLIQRKMSYTLQSSEKGGSFTQNRER